MKPILVPTDVAAAFIVRCKNQEVNAKTLRAGRERVYYLAKQKIITKHGAATKGQALWDLRELALGFQQSVTIIDPRET